MFPDSQLCLTTVERTRLPTDRGFLLRLVQAAFWVALSFTFINALLPAQHGVQISPWSRAEHVIAFYVLTLLGTVAYPRLGVIWIGFALSAFGGLIELVQGLKIVARDPELMGWIADNVGIVAALVPLLVARWRRLVEQS